MVADGERTQLDFAELSIDLDRRKVTVGVKIVELTAKELTIYAVRQKSR